MKRLWRWIKSFLKLPSNVNRPAPVYESPAVIDEIAEIGEDRLMTGRAGIDLIIEFEGFYSAPYRCPANIPTIGYGTIEYPNGQKVKMSDMPISKKDARKYLMHEINEKENAIQSFIERYGISLTPNQFDALVSFAYNLGPGPIVTPGKTMHNALISKNPLRIADSFMIYNKARVGIFRVLKPIRGLTRRRQAERDLFLS